MIVTIIGTGLIGGSMAIDLKMSGWADYIIGVDINTENGNKALELDLVDEINTLIEAVPKSDVVILAVPVDQADKILPDILDIISNGAAVLDVGSTKEQICLIADGHKNRPNFVATHPIAGTENFGPKAAFSGLFKNKITIFCDTERSAEFAINSAEHLYSSIGMKIIKMNSKEHDLHAAFVSHLSHISSFALGLTVLEIEKSEDAIFELAGSGFESTVRLAKSSPKMWAPIFEQNSEHVLEALNTYIKNLKLFRDFIEKKETNKVFEMMTEANRIRRILNNQQVFK